VVGLLFAVGDTSAAGIAVEYAGAKTDTAGLVAEVSMDTFTMLTTFEREGDSKLVKRTKTLLKAWEIQDEANEPVARYAGDQPTDLLVAPEDASNTIIGEMAGWLYAFFTEQVTLEEAAVALDWMEDSGIDTAKAVLQNVVGNKPTTKEKR